MSADVRDAIDRTNARFVASFERGDFDGVAQVYTEDASILPPGQQRIRGRSAIQEFWSGAAAALGVTGVKLETVELQVREDTAEEIGSYEISGEAGVLDRGKYVVLWKRESDDDWRWHWDIWNSSQA